MTSKDNDPNSPSRAQKDVSPELPTSEMESAIPGGSPEEREVEKISAGEHAKDVLEYAGPERKIFTVGTLVYTMSGLVLLFSWLLWGDFALSMRERSVGPLVEKFLLKHGADNFLKQLLTATLPTVIALILGPAVSYMSDRTRGRWGRRIPYLLIPTPIAGLAMIGIAFSGQLGEWLYRAFGNTPAAGLTVTQAASAYTLSVFTIFWTVFEVAVIISGSVFGGLINDVVPRSVLGRFHGLFRAVSLFDGILFNALLFQHAEQHFTLMFALIGVLFGGGFTLMCLKVKEGDYPPPPVEDEQIASTQAGVVGKLANVVLRFFKAAIGYLRECFTQPYFLLCFAMLTLAQLTFRPINDFTIRYAAQLGMPDSDYGFLVAISYVGSLMLAFPLGILVDRFHPLRMAFVAIVLYSVTAAYGSFFVHDAFTFGVALVAHTVLSGTFFTTSASIAQQLLPRSKFSQYASAGGIVSSLVMLAYAPIIGRALDFTKKEIVVNGVTTATYRYELTFWAGLVLSLITITIMLIVYRQFVAFGGTKAYVAPGDEQLDRPRHEPPAHLTLTILLYFAGAFIGVVAGYVLAYIVKQNTASQAGVGLFDFHRLILSNKDVRGMTTLCLALGIIPFGILGVWAGSKFVNKGNAASSGGH